MIGGRNGLPVNLSVAALFGPKSDAMTGEGWSQTVSGTGSRTWAGGACVLACSAAGAGSARVERSSLLPADSWEFLVRARTDTTDGTNQEQIYLVAGDSSTSYVGLASREDRLLTAFWGDPYASLATATGPTLTQRQSGNVWYRLARAPGLITWAWGEGVGGARPTRWTAIHTTSTLAVLNAASGRWVGVAVQTDAAHLYQVTALGVQTAYPGVV